MKTETQDKTYLDYKREYMERMKNNPIDKDYMKQAGFSNRLTFWANQLEGMKIRHGYCSGE